MIVYRRFVNGKFVGYSASTTGASFPIPISGLNLKPQISAAQPLPCGPGAELKKLIARFGFKPAPNCKCNQHILEMNLNGADWCDRNIDKIAGWLHEEAQRAGYPFTEIGAKILIKRAIKKSRKKG